MYPHLVRVLTKDGHPCSVLINYPGKTSPVTATDVHPDAVSDRDGADCLVRASNNSIVVTRTGIHALLKGVTVCTLDLAYIFIRGTVELYKVQAWTRNYESLPLPFFDPGNQVHNIFD